MQGSLRELSRRKDLAEEKRTVMPKSPGSARALDFQSLKQAIHSAQRAAELFLKEEDDEAVAQAALAERLLGEFIENRQPPVRRKAR
jgi:hypothetical protein